MSKIIGVTVGTPVSAELIKKKLNPVLSVNGVGADDNGNVEVEVSGGGDNNGPSEVFIDVTELPTENIRDDVIYRLLKATPLYDNTLDRVYIICHCVNGLPQRGEKCFNRTYTGQYNTGADVFLYYNAQDGKVYGYDNEDITSNSQTGMGWHPIEDFIDDLLSQFARYVGDLIVGYGGVVTVNTNLKSDFLYLLLEKEMFFYVGGAWSAVKSVGWPGEGRYAEVFNTRSNVARGWYSHAEGKGTIAHSAYQSVSGLYNVPDEVDPLTRPVGWQDVGNYRGKYAKIIGNGTEPDNRSNAHTVSWQGVGWYAEGVKVGGTGQDDDEAVNVLTEADMDTIKEYVVADLPETGGGAGAFVVHGTINYNTQTFFADEEAYEQISAALDAGQQVVVRAVDDEFGGIRVFQYTGSDDGQTPGHYFASTNGEETYFSLGVFSDNSWELIKTIFATSGFSGWSDYDKEQMMEHVLDNLPRYDGGYDLA